MSLPRGALHAGAVALLVALTACRGNTPDRPQPSSMGTAPAAAALPPVTLPDLADMDAVVQTADHRPVRHADRARRNSARRRPCSRPPTARWGACSLLPIAPTPPKPATCTRRRCTRRRCGGPTTSGTSIMRPARSAQGDRRLRARAAAEARRRRRARLACHGPSRPRPARSGRNALHRRRWRAQPRGVAALYGSGRQRWPGATTRGRRRSSSRCSPPTPARRSRTIRWPSPTAGWARRRRPETHLRQQGKVQIGPPDPLMAELRRLLGGSARRRSARHPRGGSGRLQDRGGALPPVASDLAPDSVPLRYNLARALSLTGDDAGARAAFEETIRRAPKDLDAPDQAWRAAWTDRTVQAALEQHSQAMRHRPPRHRRTLRLRRARSWASVASARRSTRLSESVRLHPDELRFAKRWRVQSAGR